MQKKANLVEHDHFKLRFRLKMNVLFEMERHVKDELFKSHWEVEDEKILCFLNFFLKFF